MKKIELLAGTIVLSLLFGVKHFVFASPFSFHDFGTLYLVTLAVLFVLCTVLIPEDIQAEMEFAHIMIILFLSLVTPIVVATASSPLFSKGNYVGQTTEKVVETSTIANFATDQVQLIDQKAAEALGDRVFGKLGAERVSQYRVAYTYDQCVVNGKLYRVAPIEFSGFFSWNSNGTTPGYIMVDCETGEAKVVEMKKGIRCTNSAYFGKDINRVVRYFMPNEITDVSKFEVDDEGNPYWITPVLSVTGISNTEDVKGVIITDPVTGLCEYFKKDDVPSWVDNVYPVSVMYKQYKQTHRYKNGLFNFAKRGVIELTDDYSYLQFDGHLFFYTGITSVGNDESNIGFTYANLRTGEFKVIELAGAEEYSAKDSAAGAYQMYGYTAKFPVMVSVNGEATYFTSLVDDAGLVKAYSFVNYQNYQIVGAGKTVEAAKADYISKLNKANNVSVDENLTENEIIAESINISYEGDKMIVKIVTQEGIYTFTK